MKTIITLPNKTVIETSSKEVVSIASKVKISSKYATNARIEKERVESDIFQAIDKGIMRANRGANQRELRRSKR